MPGDRLSATPHRCPGFVTDLVLRCADGEEEALGRLVDLFLPWVLGVVGEASSLMTDALAVEAFGRMWREAPGFDPKLGGAVAWVLEQARLTRVDTLRRGGLRSATAGD
ncbi:MAG: hypothetical protein F2667_00605 [Actinobacteria bacterium]|uniref:Unannotated protein n=1 Tax=freshwater metagenome TaxID=449393 RepID=A0A6J6NHN4_9ZZZZ|nr:hypothetical protein [Actinomycetota bacterium]